MNLFKDCEIVRQHLRGQTAVVIVGDRAVTSEEGAALLAEFADSFGERHTPIYFSAGGWQVLTKKTVKAKPSAAETKAAAVEESKAAA